MATEEKVIEVDGQQDQQNPQDPPTKRRLLYDAVAKEYDLGTYDEFENNLKDLNKRKAFYDAVGQEYDLGTYDEFQSQIGFSVKKKVGTLDFEKSSMASGNGLQGGESTTLPQEEGIPTISMYETKDGDAIRTDDIFGLVNKKSQLKEAVIPRVSGSTGGASVSFSADPEKLKESKELGEFIKSQGYDPDELENDFNGIPEDAFKIEGLSKNEILSDYKENPQLYKRKIGTIKWQAPLLDNMREAGVSYKSIDDAIRNIVAPDNSYANVRRNVKDIYKAIEQYGGDNKDEMLKNFTIDISKAYAKGGDEVDKVMQDERAKYLNENQLIGLQFLEDTDPRKAQGFSQLLIDPSLIQGDDNVKRGWEEKAKKLEQIGLGIQQSAVQEDINQLKRKYKDGRKVTPQDAENRAALELKKESLTNKSKELNLKYPSVQESEINSAIVDLMGKNINTPIGVYPLVKLGHEVENTAEGIWSLASEPFRSEESSKLHQLAIAGEKNLSERILSAPSNENILKSFSTEFTPKLKALVDPIINNKDLSDIEKYKQLYSVLKGNPGEYARVPLKGSKVNINPASLWYSVSDLGATLLPFMAFETLTGGGATAGAARKLASQFTAAAATSFNTVYADAVKEGVPNPFGYALRVTAINSAAMAGAGTAGEIKKMLGTKTAIGELVNSMSDDAINALLNKKGTSAIKDFGKVIGKSFLEGAKTGAKFETLMAGAEIANAVIDKEKINPKEMAKKGLVGTLNFSLFGTGTGAKSQYRKLNELEGGSLLKASENPTDYLNEAQRQLSEKEITPEQYNQISENIKDAATVGKRIEYIDNDGKPLSEKKKAELLVEKLREYKLQESVRGDVPTQFREKVQKEIEKVKENVEKIYEPEQEDTRTEIEMPNEAGREVLTKEAEDLLKSVGEGSMPTFITKNLERIAADNGIEITDKMSAVDVINALKEKKQSIDTNEPTTEVREPLDEVMPESKEQRVETTVPESIEPVSERTTEVATTVLEESGRTPVTLSGSTEPERQLAIEQRKKETNQTPLNNDRNVLLERINKYNGLSRIDKRKAVEELNKIKIAVDNFNKKHNQQHSVSRYRNGEVQLKGNPKEGSSVGRTIKYKLSGNESSIVEGKPLFERADKTREVFDQLLEANSLPVARRINGEKMSEAEHEATITDIMDGIPSQRAENYLNSLEKQIAEDAFDFANPDPNIPLPKLNEILGVGKETDFEKMTPEKVDEWLSKESELTPEETEVFDNIENLITYYEQRNDTEGGTKTKVSEPTKRTAAEDSGKANVDESAKTKTEPTESTETESVEQPSVGAFSEEKRTILSHRGLQEIATEFGLDDVTSRERKSDLQLLKDAETTINKWVENGEYAKNVESLVKEAESGKILNDEQRVIVEQHIANVRKQASDIKKSEGVNSPNYDSKLKELQRLTKAGEITRSEAGAALRLPKSSSMPMASLENAMVAKMEANDVETLTEKQKQEVIAQYDKYESALKEMTDKYEEAERKNAELLAQMELKNTYKNLAGKKGVNQKEVRESLKNQLKKEFENYKASAQKLGVASDGGAESFAITVKMAKIITDIIKSHVSEVGDNLKEVTKRVLDDLKSIMPGITERDVQDVIAGKYSEKKPTQSEVVANMRSLREQQKLIDEYNRLINGGEPKEERAKIKRNQRLAELRKMVSDLNTDKPLKQVIERINKQIAEYERRLKEKDFEIVKKVSWVENPEFKKRNPKLYKEALDAYTKKEDLKHEFDVELFKDEMSRRTKLEKASDVLSKSVGTAKAIVTGIDDSALFIQTLVSSFARPVIGAKAFKQHVLDAFSQKRFDRSLAELHNSPYWDLMQKSGLDITEPKSLSAEKKEEVFNNRFSGTVKIKGKEYKLLDAPLKPFERAFTSLGNASRAIAFKTFADKYISEGYTFEKDPELFKSLARRLNEQTGRGKENEYVKKASQLVTMGIWSPKLMSAKFNLLGLSDAASLLLSKAGTKGYYRQLHPKERVAAIKDIANFATSVMALSYLIAFSTGGTVDDDPSSTTFLDIKLSDGKSYNISGQFGSYIRNIVQVARGGKTKNGEFKPYGKNQNAFSQIGDFFRGKTPPVTSAVINTIKGQDYMGRPTDALKEGQNLLTPMSVKGIVSQLERDGVSSLFTQGIPTFAGVNVKDEKDYQDQDKNKFTIYDAHSNKKRESTDEEYKKYQDELTKRLEDKLSVLKRIGVGLNKYGEITIDRSKIVKRKKYEDFTEKEKLNLKSRIKSSESEKIKKEFKF